MNPHQCLGTSSLSNHTQQEKLLGKKEKRGNWKIQRRNIQPEILVLRSREKPLKQFQKYPSSSGKPGTHFTDLGWSFYEEKSHSWTQEPTFPGT